MNTPTAIFLGIHAAALWLWLAWQIARAPFGYEDKQGFHKGEKQP